MVSPGLTIACKSCAAEPVKLSGMQLLAEPTWSSGHPIRSTPRWSIGCLLQAAKLGMKVCKDCCVKNAFFSHWRQALPRIRNDEPFTLKVRIPKFLRTSRLAGTKFRDKHLAYPCIFVSICCCMHVQAVCGPVSMRLTQPIPWCSVIVLRTSTRFVRVDGHTVKAEASLHLARLASPQSVIICIKCETVNPDRPVRRRPPASFTFPSPLQRSGWRCLCRMG